MIFMVGCSIGGCSENLGGIITLVVVCLIVLFLIAFGIYKIIKRKK